MKARSRIGEKWTDNVGNEIEIIEDFGTKNCSIKFNKGHIVKNIQYSNIVNKRVKDPYLPSVFGIGYIGIGKHLISISGLHTKKYLVWKGILERCYSNYRSRPTYNGCAICDEWMNFQIFGDWYDLNYDEFLMKDWHLDKDILFAGNKIYSPNTCCFVPKEINALFKTNNIVNSIYGDGVYKKKNRFVSMIGIFGKRIHLGSFLTHNEAFEVYKNNKKSYIIHVANLWKDKISVDVYNSMIAYKI